MSERTNSAFVLRSDGDPEEGERRNWKKEGENSVKKRGGKEKFARTFFGVLSRRRPRSLDTREPAASFRGSLEYYLSGS